MNVSRRTAVLASISTLLIGCDQVSGKTASFRSMDITGVDFARRLDLPDTTGKMRSLGDWKGKVVVVFFGYTQCPDACPTTLAGLAQIRKSLGADGDRLQVVFVTVDPDRDTPAILKAYVDNFGPGVVALRGNAVQTATAAKEFKVFYAKVKGKTPDTYSMDHTAASYVFDTAGRVRLFVPYGGDTKSLAADLKQLAAGT